VNFYRTTRRHIAENHTLLSLNFHFFLQCFDLVCREHAVVKALCYKPEGRGFEIRLGEIIFPVYVILSAALDPGVYSAGNRNVYQKQKNNVSGE
jgi:hypothetical protein